MRPLLILCVITGKAYVCISIRNFRAISVTFLMDSCFWFCNCILKMWILTFGLTASLSFPSLAVHLQAFGVASIPVPESKCYTFDNSSHLIDFVSYLSYLSSRRIPWRKIRYSRFPPWLLKLQGIFCDGWLSLHWSIHAFFWCWISFTDKRICFTLAIIWIYVICVNLNTYFETFLQTILIFYRMDAHLKRCYLSFHLAFVPPW